ncbi:hypothetical protein JYU34_006710 [Plutella xylostella]|uniref:Uncharacterized protein n=2 Tax=Plutella xylostella TaxID=51655 RepID=A0ABQ7QSR4_PLUXY|nr:hypothetical protein JYU34_006710 [Plutella xylostella]CAG9132116.1 unnamed protein product [Plutella xylostella]
MDCISATEKITIEEQTFQDNVLLEMIKEICSEPECLSSNVREKVNTIIADCDLAQYTGLHKLSTADETTSTLLGFTHSVGTELTYDEQAELNQALIQRIQDKIPKLTSELEQLTEPKDRKSRKEQIKDLQESLDAKLKILEEQESEKVDIMMQWLNHRVHHIMKYEEDSTELLTVKTKILEVKSHILHLQILQNIFTETNQSIKAYREVHKDILDSIKESEEQIKKFQEIVGSEELD